MSKQNLSQEWWKIFTHSASLICIPQLHKNNSSKLNKHKIFLVCLTKMHSLNLTNLNIKENFQSHFCSQQFSMKLIIFKTYSKFQFIINHLEKKLIHLKKFSNQRLNKSLKKISHLASNTLSIFILVWLVIQLKNPQNLKIMILHYRLKEVTLIIKKVHHSYQKNQ